MAGKTINGKHLPGTGRGTTPQAVVEGLRLPSKVIDERLNLSTTS
jgi:hypothetical protein